jgi:hypothetical protein
MVGLLVQTVACSPQLAGDTTVDVVLVGAQASVTGMGAPRIDW